MLQRLYRYGYSLTDNEAAAHDLLQSAVERYYRADPDSIRSATPWIRRVMRNQFIDQRRRQQRFPEVELELGAMDIGLQNLENQVIAAVELDAVWKQLTVEEREMLHLWAVEGYSTQEIATATDTPRNTILSRIHRLRQKLRGWREARRATGAGR